MWAAHQVELKIKITINAESMFSFKSALQSRPLGGGFGFGETRTAAPQLGEPPKEQS
jgi:hypothetical protein